MQTMKKSTFFNLIFISIAVLTSCTTTKEITMLQDSDDTLNRYDIPPEAPEHKIQPFDNLYLSVLTMDPEVNSLFDPSTKGDGYASGTEQMYGSPTSRSINGYRVSKQGTITIPIIGEIKLVGLSLHEAQNRIKEKAVEYLIDPTVMVKYLNYKVNVLGEVRFPGIFYNYEGTISILEAISMANGITDYADVKNTLVKRQNGNKIVTQKIDLTDNSIYSSDFFYLQPNDLIYIPPSKLKRRRENAQTYSQILSTISVLLVSVTLIVNL